MKLIIAGAAGRMGKSLIEATLSSRDMSLGAALEMPGNSALGRDAGEGLGSSTGISITSDIHAAVSAGDCLIDFTRPDGTLAHLAQCVALAKAAVIGTTGFSAEQKALIAEAADEIPVVFAPNMAVGVNVTFKLAEVAAKILGEGYDVEIIEAHHRHKADAPSGTALRLGEVVANALGRDLNAVELHGREGITGERDPKAIAFHAIRGGDIVGEHTVLFAGEGERVEVTVRSSSRMTYAVGALRAARFLAGKKKGLYDMWDVLGLR
ncbi:MAG TPA: 4-hydroxy-tetrahydrodipicolinate reductase [Burkholderiales bacterium]|jgi:4-hydroxy-tetrahydrodipicolinate reductase|nr:4-hydroxy-tetrahydrodipicolinate reductase [Burkholderiales bacterium]